MYNSAVVVAEKKKETVKVNRSCFDRVMAELFAVRQSTEFDTSGTDICILKYGTRQKSPN